MICRFDQSVPASASALNRILLPSAVKPYGSRKPVDWNVFTFVSDGTPPAQVRVPTWIRHEPKMLELKSDHCSAHTTRLPVASNRAQMSAFVPCCSRLTSFHACFPSVVSR